MNTHATSALAELAGMAAVPGRASVLAGQIGAALQPAAADQHRELFLAAALLLQARQRGPVPDAAWSRLWDACGALLEHYGIEAVEDLAALEGYAA